VVNAPSSLFSVGNHISLSSHNWGLDLCGGVPCDLPREVVRDSISMSMSSRNNAPNSRDTTQELAGMSGRWCQWVVAQELMIR